MTNQLKQRIVGGVVILCVVTIFLPVLFHKPKTTAAKSVPMTIPKPMSVSQMSLQLPLASSQDQVQQTQTSVNPLTRAEQKVEYQSTAAPQSKPQVAVQAAKLQHKQQINTKILQAAVSLPQAWVVQLGSFSKSQHAKNLGTTPEKARARGLYPYSSRRAA